MVSAVTQTVGAVTNAGTQIATPVVNNALNLTINVAGLSADGDGVVNKLIAKTPIKIAQELKQENENEQKQTVESASGLLILHCCRQTVRDVTNTGTQTATPVVNNGRPDDHGRRVSRLVAMAW